MSDFKRNWKILYSDYSGMEKKAIELVAREMGRQIIRDKGIYTIHVLACEKIGAPIDKNVVVIGRYDANPVIQRFISREDIPENGYAVKVMDNPDQPELKIALITGMTDRDVFYGAIDFVDDYFVFAAPVASSCRLTQEIFEQKHMPDYFSASAPHTKTRGIFTWGQPIIDYRNYIENMARMRLNQLIIWNDFVPLNANDLVQYAHEFGIEVLWGFAWGWSTDCNQIDLEHLDQLTESVIAEYEEKYACIEGDGIYFQSFTELPVPTIGGKLIAEVVTDFVNQTADRLLQRHPGLHIQFGLHASSVKDHLHYLSHVDPRVEILWEDCGTYPFFYLPIVKDDSDYQSTRNFTEDVIQLRGDAPLGLVFKGQLTLDWFRFTHQSGPYIIGNESPDLVQHDREMMQPMWRILQSEWIKNGHYAHELFAEVAEKYSGNVGCYMAGTLPGGIWFPTALCAQLFWDSTQPFADIVEKVSKRNCVTMA